MPSREEQTRQAEAMLTPEQKELQRKILDALHTPPAREGMRRLNEIARHVAGADAIAEVTAPPDRVFRALLLDVLAEGRVSEDLGRKIRAALRGTP